MVSNKTTETVNILATSSPEKQENEAKALKIFGIMNADKLVNNTYTFVTVVGFVGLVFNFASFKTSLKLPKNMSSSAILIRYLAVWDSIALLFGLLDIGLERFLKVTFINHNVSDSR